MRGFAGGYVNIVRNTPLTLIILFTSVGLASTLGVQLVDPNSPTSLADNNYRLAVLGFVAYTATFVCESIRSGINTVPVGQAEAARAIGLSFFQTLRMIVMPQAFRSVIAPLTNVLIAMISIVIALPLGAVFGLGRMSDHKFVSTPAGVVVEVCRAVPVLIFMIFANELYAYYSDIGRDLRPMFAAVTGLVLYNGAVLAEIVRAGVNSLPTGQHEAA